MPIFGTLPTELIIIMLSEANSWLNEVKCNAIKIGATVDSGPAY